MIFKKDEALGGKTVYKIGKCKTNCKALIIPNINCFSPALKKFNNIPNKNIYLKPLFALLAELKIVLIA